MKTLFVIGGIGAGKSAAAQCLADAGVPVFDLDKAGHDVLRLPAARDMLVEAFGPGILDAEGGISREALAARAFGTPQSSAALAEITHPFILGALREWIDGRAADGFPVAAVEASAFDGTKGDQADLADYVVAVTAPPELRVERAVAKGFAEDDVRRRIAAQPSDAQRQAWADFVVANDGSRDRLCRQMAQVLAQVSSSAG